MVINNSVAPSDARRAWCEVELVVKTGSDGHDSLRCWIAAAPIDELPPRIMIDFGTVLEVVEHGIFGIGISRPSW